MFGNNLGSTGRGAKLSVERLEEKTLLAGDVHVVVSDGDLRITGDDQNNEIQVIATADFGEYLVRGEELTRINGSLDDEILVRGVNDDIRIDMKGGNNEIALLGEVDNELVLLNALFVPDDVFIHNGSGRIEVITQDVHVADDLRIHLRDGSDDILLSETEVGDDLDIRAHGGIDDVLLDVVLVGDDALLDLGEGRNLLSIDESLIRDDLTITGGHAILGDTISIRESVVGDDLRIYAHAGNDEVCMFEVEVRDLHIHMGDGNDRLDLGFVDVDEQTRLNGDDGFDTFGETGSQLRDLSLETFEAFDDFIDCLDPVVEPLSSFSASRSPRSPRSAAF